MNIERAEKVRRVMEESGTMMAYNGVVSDELMLTLADLLKNRLKDMDDSKLSRTVFTVFMEAMQNLIWHGKNGKQSKGMISISQKDDKEIVVICSNRVKKDNSSELKRKLEKLKEADKNTIRQLYREGMTKSADHDGPGAGLGLLEMARRASHPIAFSFIEIDKEHDDFYLAVRI